MFLTDPAKFSQTFVATVGSEYGANAMRAGVEANDDNVVNGTYAISRPFLVVNKKDNLSEEAKSFVDFILSEEGQNIVSEEGFIKATIK